MVLLQGYQEFKDVIMLFQMSIALEQDFNYLKRVLLTKFDNHDFSALVVCCHVWLVIFGIAQEHSVKFWVFEQILAGFLELNDVRCRIRLQETVDVSAVLQDSK